MFTLIMREIEDNRVFFIAVVILAVIFGVLFVYQHFNGERYESMADCVRLCDFNSIGDCFLRNGCGADVLGQDKKDISVTGYFSGNSSADFHCACYCRDFCWFSLVLFQSQGQSLRRFQNLGSQFHSAHSQGDIF